MIQDIAERYHNEYKEQSPKAGDYIMFVNGRNVLIKKDFEEIEYLCYEDLVGVTGIDMTFCYLFSVDTVEGTKRFFLGETDTLPEEFLTDYEYAHKVYPMSRTFSFLFF